MVIASECAPSAPKSISNLPVIVVPSSTVAELSASIVGTSSFTLTSTVTSNSLPFSSLNVTFTLSAFSLVSVPCCVWSTVSVNS